MPAKAGGALARMLPNGRLESMLRRRMIGPSCPKTPLARLLLNLKSAL
jgi:hypothetical protein